MRNQVGDRFTVRKSVAEHTFDIAMGTFVLVVLLGSLSALLFLFGMPLATAWKIPWSFKLAASLIIIVNLLLLPCYVLLCGRR